MGIYIDPVLIILYIIATSSLIGYAFGFSWLKQYLKFVPSQIDIMFTLTDAKCHRAMIAILDYLDRNKCQFSTKKLFHKGITVSFKQVANLIERNNVESFRLMSLDNKHLVIEVKTEYTTFKFGCTCTLEVFDTLLKIMERTLT